MFYSADAQTTSCRLKRSQMGSIESVGQGLDAHLVLTAYDQLVIETRKDCCDRVAQVLEEVMIEAGRDILDPVPVMVDIKIGKYWS